MQRGAARGQGPRAIRRLGGPTQLARSQSTACWYWGAVRCRNLPQHSEAPYPSLPIYPPPPKHTHTPYLPPESCRRAVPHRLPAQPEQPSHLHPRWRRPGILWPVAPRPGKSGQPAHPAQQQPVGQGDVRAALLHGAAPGLRPRTLPGEAASLPARLLACLRGLQASQGTPWVAPMPCHLSPAVHVASWLAASGVGPVPPCSVPLWS